MLKKIFFGFGILIALMLPYSVNAAIITPAEGAEHPYVYLSDDFIAGLRDENGELKPAYAKAYNAHLSIARSSIGAQPEGGYLSTTTSNRIVSRALMYALGEFDYEHARETIEFTLEYLKKPLTAQTYSINMYKDIGTNGIQVGALVYDWCYDAMTEEERVLLGKYILEMYGDTNGDGSPNYKQPASIKNTSGWGDIAGKAVGQPLLYNCIAVTALYDLYPSIYNNVMEKVQGTMAKALKAYGSAGALTDGSISYTRDHYSYYVYVLLKRLGASDKKLNAIYGDQQALGYKLMYSRLPYGTYFRYGDNHPNTINNYSNGVETTDLGMLASMYDNGYFKYQYVKENNSGSGSSIIGFLMLCNETEPKLPDDLPLAYETKSPRTEVMARTSWQDGIKSKTVVVDMNMNERRSGDHDHGDIGSFQLYYKGPLTMPAGIYRGEEWGGTHWRNYYTRSIAANCMTVYMPGEVYKYGNKIAEANDGGQKMAGSSSGGYVIGEYDEHFADTNIWAVTEGTYIGPNKQTPAFSYLKGDLTKAYSSEKLSSYKRGMVFMDTYNDTYPGVFVVFDRVVSKDATYDKKWLLQSVTDPEVSGNKITITNTTDGANGKLINTTLLPENVEIDKVGGKATYISDGKEWPAPDTVDFSKIPEAYASGYRLEVSPKAENTEDIFLNAMYVTDADGNAPQLNMIKENTNEFVGVTTLDRMVLFSKSGNFVSNTFKITVRDNNAGKEMLCLITDVNPGKWTVIGSERIYVLESVDGDNCLTVSLAPGTYTFEPASSSANLTTLTWPEAEKEKFGDFAIKLDSAYAYIPDETYLKDGVPYVSAATAEQLGADVTINGNTITFKKWQNTSVVTVGEYSFKHNNLDINLNNPAIIHNGTIYVPILELKSAIGISANYVPDALTIYCTSSKQVELENFISPISGSGVDNLGVLCDGIICEKLNFTANAYPYTNTPVTFYYGDTPRKITNIAVSGANGTSKVKIFASLDGKNYHLINTKGYSINKDTYAYVVDEVLRYIKFIPLESISVSEVAAYGGDADFNCKFITDNILEHNISEDFKTEAYIKSGFDSAQLFVGDVNVLDFNPSSDSVYDVVIPSQVLSGFSDGSYDLTIKANYGSECFESTRKIILVERKNEYNVLTESFDGGSYGKVFGNKGTCNFSRNIQNATESYNSGKYTITFNKQVISSCPYVSVTNFVLGRGKYELNFETEITSPYIDVMLEPRNKNNKALSTGASYTILSGMTGEFDVTIVADIENSILQVWVKEKGSEGEKVLLREHAIKTDGFAQFRFNVTNRGESGSTSFNNLIVNYKEIGMSIISPKYSENIVEKNVLLSAYAGDADEVSFCINGEEIKKFTSTDEDGIYEFETEFDTAGIKYFDVIVKDGDNTYIKSTSFVYGTLIRKGEKTFAGPFVPKVQNDGHYWINATNTTTYFTGRVVFEGELTIPTTSDRVYFELGGATEYDFKYGGNNYITLSDVPGYGDSATALFNENGKIADTDYTYTANEPMNFKLVCDTITDTYEVYIDNQLVLTKAGIENSGSGKVSNLVSAKVVGCKVRMVYRDTNEDGLGLPSLCNVKTYQEDTMPMVAGVYYDGNNAYSNAGYVIPNNTQEITILLSKAYSNISSGDLIVKLDDKVLEDYTFNLQDKSITLSDIDITEGGKLNIIISKNATTADGLGDKSLGVALETDIYVGNSERIYIFPIDTEYSSENKIIYATTKYINASDAAKDISFILVEYADKDLSILSNVAYKSTSLKYGTRGLISNEIGSVVSAENCRVMIWDKELSPITGVSKIN